MATNRADTLDPALLRPGRLDRKIEFPHPDRRQKRLVFTACTSKMNLSEEVSGCSNVLLKLHCWCEVLVAYVICCMVDYYSG
jgi:ATP-dependent 26S proteasome regulatory subunit